MCYLIKFNLYNVTNFITEYNYDNAKFNQLVDACINSHKIPNDESILYPHQKRPVMVRLCTIYIAKKLKILIILTCTFIYFLLNVQYIYSTLNILETFTFIYPINGITNR